MFLCRSPPPSQSPPHLATTRNYRIKITFRGIGGRPSVNLRSFLFSCARRRPFCYKVGSSLCCTVAPLSPTRSHLTSRLIVMADRRLQHIFEGLRPPPCTRCQGRCSHYLCPNCALNLSPCMSPIGGLGNPNAMCCNCWCEDVRKCVMGCGMTDSSSDDEISDYQVTFYHDSNEFCTKQST
jgi:hypothetical protein